MTCSYPATSYSAGAGTVPAYGGPATTGDPLAKSQWGLSQVKAPAAWARGARGAGALIAVLDTGVDFSHPDLAGKLLAGTDLTGAVKDDLSGTAEPAGGACPGPQDEHGHGTHVAGIAAAVTGNGIGVAGVAPDAQVIPVRVLASDGREPEEGTVYQGIRWAADAGADVINLSLSGLPGLDYADGSDEEGEKAVDYAWSKGAVVVASAGNESFPLCSYPSAAKRAVCVAATDAGEAPTFYSNFPATPDQNVAVRAPGGLGSVFCEDSEDVWSTVWPGGETTCGDLHGYETFAGSSMSAPHVAGVAALLAGRGLSNAQIVECIRTTSSNGGEYDPVMGYGIVDADAATSRCAAPSTPGFEPPPQPSPSPSPSPGPSPDPGPPSGQPPGGDEAQVTVTVKRTSRRRLAKSGRLTVVVRSDRAVTVKLRAVLTRAKTKRTAGSARVRLGKAGRRTVVVRLSRSARRALARSRKYRLVVRWRAGARTGSATATR